MPRAGWMWRGASVRGEQRVCVWLSLYTIQRQRMEGISFPIDSSRCMTCYGLARINYSGIYLCSPISLSFSMFSSWPLLHYVHGT